MSRIPFRLNHSLFIYSCMANILFSLNYCSSFRTSVNIPPTLSTFQFKVKRLSVEMLYIPSVPTLGLHCSSFNLGFDPSPVNFSFSITQKNLMFSHVEEVSLQLKPSCWQSAFWGLRSFLKCSQNKGVTYAKYRCSHLMESMNLNLAFPPFTPVIMPNAPPPATPFWSISKMSTMYTPTHYTNYVFTESSGVISNVS